MDYIYKWVKLSKLGIFKNVELNILSCRAFCGISENDKQNFSLDQQNSSYDHLKYCNYLVSYILCVCAGASVCVRRGEGI